MSLSGSQFGYLPSYNNSSMTQLSDVSPAVPTSGQVLAWDATTGKWTPTSAAGGGDVNGPSTSTDQGLARYDGTTGQFLRDSSVTLSDAAGLAGVTSLTLQGNTTANVLSIMPDAATSAYVLTLPPAQGSAGTFLTNNGSGSLSWASAAGGGNVIGPGSSTSTAIARYNGTSGTSIQNSGVTIDGSNNIAGAGTASVSGLTLRGATSGTIALQAASTTTSQTLTLPSASASANQFLRNDGTGLLSWSSPAGGGNVTGPASSTNTAVARYNGTSGTALQDSGVTIDGSNNVSASGFTMRGATSGTVALQAGATTASQTLTLPTSAAGAGQYLTNDGTGLLSWSSPAGGGNVLGPGSSTNTAIARYNGTTGTSIQDSGITIDGANNILGAANASVSGLTLRGTGPTSGDIVLRAATTTTAQTLTFPSAAAIAGQILSNDGTGALSWTSLSSTFGDVFGPAGGATDNALCRFDLTSGKIIQNSTVILSDTGAFTGIRELRINGTTSGNVGIQASATTTNYTVLMPPSQGAAGTFLSNSGTGQLSWQTAVTGPNTTTDNALARYNGTGTSGPVVQDSVVTLSDTGGLAGLSEVRMSGSSSGNVGIQAFSSTTSYTLVMPSTQGASGTYLTNNGTGQLAWSNGVAGPNTSTNFAIPRFNGTSGNQILNSGVAIDGSNNMYGMNSMSLRGSSSGNLLTIQPVTTTNAYTLTYPSAQGNNRQVMRNNGSGGLYWSRMFINGRIQIGDIGSGTVATILNVGSTLSDFTFVTKASVGGFGGATSSFNIFWNAIGEDPITYSACLIGSADTANNDVNQPLCTNLTDGNITLSSSSTQNLTIGITVFY